MADPLDNVTFSLASAKHAESAACLIYASGPSVFDFLYNYDPALRQVQLAEQWLMAEGLLSHRFATAAVEGGRLLGIALGYDAATRHEQLQHTINYITEHNEAAIKAQIDQAWSDLKQLSPAVPDETYYLQYLAVVSADRSRGIGRQLLHETLERAVRDGCTSVGLDVAAETPEVGFYQHLGFRVVCESRVPYLADHHGIGSHYRMTKPLSAAPVGVTTS